MEENLTQAPVDSPSLGTDQRWLKAFIKGQNTKVILGFISVFGLLFLSMSVYLSYVLWWQAIPSLWRWAFSTYDFDSFWKGLGTVVKVILSLAGIILAFATPLLFIVTILVRYFSILFQELPALAEDIALKKIKENQQKEDEYEKTLKKDSDELIIWVNYSRIELEQYYKIGLQQGRRSYQHSVIAMWIGFIIMVFGILLYFLPSIFDQIKVPNNSNLQILTISSGIVSEIIAGLFLWIYQSSRNQLTYFYNRQVFIHNSLIAYKMANSIDAGETKNNAKREIIEKILEFGISVSPLPPMESLGNKKKAASAKS